MKHLKDIKGWQECINQVICGDSLDLMKMIPDNAIDLCLTDPPYGIGADKGVGGGSKRGAVKKFVGNWDSFTPTQEFFDEMMRISKNQIIFGGNYFIEYLYSTPCYLVWDKREGLPPRTFADCEMAWSSYKSPARIFRFKWDGMIQENMKQKEQRVHPTQKPTELMRWCLENHAKDCKTIIDPFAGSFTTARACKDMGYDWICIDKEEQYCTVGEKRLEQEVLF